jgi:hypothetical protein
MLCSISARSARAAKQAVREQNVAAATAPLRPGPVIARNEAIHCGIGTTAWIATALRASQ